MGSINRDAHVPMTGADVIRPNTPPGLKQMSPISVDTSQRIPGAGKVKDYIPSPSKRLRILQAKGLVPKEQPAPHSRDVVRHTGKDYLSAEESKKLRDVKGKEINALAKAIWSRQADARKRYKLALKIIADATVEDLENPSPKLRKAMAIQDQGPPITQDQAKREARSQVYKG